MERPEYWWIQDESIATIGQALEQRNFVVVDGFVGQPVCEQLRDEVKAAYEKGALSPGGLAGGRTGSSLQYVMTNVRGDHIGWFTGKESELGWKQLPEFIIKVDTLVNELKAVVPGLQRVDSRSNAMCTCYPGSGAHYIRHCDNPNINGRILTAIYYMNCGWQPEDGGQLRIYSCLKDARSAEGFTDCDGASLKQWDAVHPNGDELPTARDAGPLGAGLGTEEGSEQPQASAVMVADVEPLGDRLLLFYSDKRVPHEVLPTKSFRYAITTWFMSTADAEEARANPDSQKEDQSIKDEIASMQTKYGGSALVRNVAKGDQEASTSGASSHLPREVAGRAEAQVDAPTERLSDSTVEPAALAEVPVASRAIPEYTLQLRTEGASSTLELTVQLSGVASIQDVAIDVEPRRVLVDAVKYMLDVKLPNKVDANVARASFKRKDQRLTVTLPLAGG